MTQPAADRPADIVRDALEHEHREIDRSIEAFVAGRGNASETTEHLRTAIAALRRHIYVEEEFLFPPLRVAGMLAPVLVMLSEHRELWRTMAELEERLDAGDSPSDLTDAARTLLAQLDRHNSKEEPIIYGQADVLLPIEDRTDLRERLAEEMPAGWACAGLV